jgi:hypothetical protein
MKLKVNRTDVWAATVEDRPGGVATKLEALAQAGANLGFVLARRTPERGPGQGVVFVTPLKGKRQETAAAQAGFVKTDSIRSLRVEGADKAGVGAAVTRAIADAGINLRGLSAASLGRKFVMYVALDSESDATRAMQTLRKL